MSRVGYLGLLLVLAVFLAPIACTEDNAVDTDKIQIELEVPGEAVSLAEVNKSQSIIKIKITNTADEDVVLSPFYSLAVFDADGDAVDSDSWIGRFGARSAPCLLEEFRFTTLEAGKSTTLESGLVNWMYDPEAITGWKLPAAGTYTLKLTYSWDPDAWKKTCGADCAGHADPDKPWNRAPAFSRTVEAELTVK